MCRCSVHELARAALAASTVTLAPHGSYHQHTLPGAHRQCVCRQCSSSQQQVARHHWNRFAEGAPGIMPMPRTMAGRAGAVGARAPTGGGGGGATRAYIVGTSSGSHSGSMRVTQRMYSRVVTTSSVYLRHI